MFLSAKLYDIYNDAIQWIDDQSSSARELGNKILKWISHACRPLPLLELGHLLAIDAETWVLDLDFMSEEVDLTSV